MARSASIGTFNPAMLVHGEQAIELHQPIPAEGTIRTTSKITGIYDKGKAAVVVTEAKSVDAKTGEPLLTTRMSAFIRGEGGWGGDRGPAGAQRAARARARPQRHLPDPPDQALIYRLSGDRNPLHSDPSFAAMGGFDTPILHGLCTYGFTGRALLHSLCGGDPARSRRWRAGSRRRSSPATASRSTSGSTATATRSSRRSAVATAARTIRRHRPGRCAPFS